MLIPQPGDQFTFEGNMGYVNLTVKFNYDETVTFHMDISYTGSNVIIETDINSLIDTPATDGEYSDGDILYYPYANVTVMEYTTYWPSAWSGIWVGAEICFADGAVDNVIQTWGIPFK